MYIINFINHETSMMASVHQLANRKYIVHLDDLDSDMRFPESRIFSDVDKAAAYAEKIVKSPTAGNLINGPVFS